MKMQLLALMVVCFACAVFASDEFVCQEGVFYKENNCNRCWCQNGHLACHMMGCIGKGTEDLQKCEPGTKTQVDCNDCVCLKKVGTLCTDHDCTKL